MTFDEWVREKQFIKAAEILSVLDEYRLMVFTVIESDEEAIGNILTGWPIG